MRGKGQGCKRPYNAPGITHAHAGKRPPLHYLGVFAKVAGVMTQFCDDTTCAVAVSDAEGVSLYEAENAYAYEVHVLKVPEGYERVTDNFVMEANGGEIEVTLKKAA